MSSFQISNHAWWVGVKDPGLRVFDIVMPTQYGTTYNAYLVKGTQKVALIDTVKKEFAEEYFANIASITPLESIDYLIVNHTEPDHSGAISQLLLKCPKIKIVCAGASCSAVQSTLLTWTG